MRKAAVVDLDFHTLSRLLSLPEGQRVARAEYDICTDSLRVLIEGEGLPELPAGCPAYTLRPVMQEVRRVEIDWSATHG
jgi:hypothetical protein